MTRDEWKRQRELEAKWDWRNDLVCAAYGVGILAVGFVFLVAVCSLGVGA